MVRASGTAGCARRPGTASRRHVLVVQRWDVCGGRAHRHGVAVPSSVTTTLGTRSVHRLQRTQAPDSRWRAKLHRTVLVDCMHIILQLIWPLHVQSSDIIIMLEGAQLCRLLEVAACAKQRHF